MQLTIKDIGLYSRCPKQYFYYKNLSIIKSASLSKTRTIIKDIIKQSYINRTQHGYDPQWQTIKTRINKSYFSNIDISKKESFEPIYKQSIATMGVLHYWYHKIFIKDNHDAFINIPLNIEISKSIISSSIDILLLDNKLGPIPIIFDDEKLAPIQLKNNIEYKTLLFLLYKELSIVPQQAEYAIITEDSVKYQTMYNKLSIENIEKYVNFIVRGIENSIYYPSVNEQCNNCNFKDICVL